MRMTATRVAGLNLSRQGRTLVIFWIRRPAIPGRNLTDPLDFPYV